MKVVRRAGACNISWPAQRALLRRTVHVALTAGSAATLQSEAPLHSMPDALHSGVERAQPPAGIAPSLAVAPNVLRVVSTPGATAASGVAVVAPSAACFVSICTRRQHAHAGHASTPQSVGGAGGVGGVGAGGEGGDGDGGGVEGGVEGDDEGDGGEGRGGEGRGG
jgi:hypothetical protein